MSTFPDRRSDMLREAEARHAATEAAQVADLSWLDGALQALPDGRRGIWQVRIDALRRRVHASLDGIAVLLRAATAAGEQGRRDFELRLRDAERRSTDLWIEIEADELRLALAFPAVLSRGPDVWPPHLRDLAAQVERAQVFLRRQGEEAPREPVDLALTLVGIVRTWLDRSDQTEELTSAAATAVALLRYAVRRDPESLTSRLGTALVVLAACHLAHGEVDEATIAAVEACTLAPLDEVPAEIRGLAEP